MNLSIEPHPLLDPIALSVVFPAPLGDTPTVANLDAWLSLDADAPLQRSDELKAIVRDLLRHGGFKPTGRSKPASEYLVKAVENERLGSINAAVDACNIASLHSGLPISVVDQQRGTSPWRIGLADKGTEYVFNPTGQVINIGGLISLFDAQGPCGGPVKDSQRTKTSDETTHTLFIIWGTLTLPGRSEQTATWLTSLLTDLGATVTRVAPADHPG